MSEAGSSARSLAVTAVAGIAVFAALRATKPATVPSEIRIVSTNDLRARVRRCGCQGERGANVDPNQPRRILPCSCKAAENAKPDVTLPDLGGIPERSTWLAQRRAATGDAIQVDAGDLLFPKLRATPFEEPEWRRQAELLVELQGLLGISVFTPGELDLALGRRALEEVLAKATFRTISSNLVDAKTRRTIFPPRTVVEFGGARVGFVGLFDPPASIETKELLEREGLAVLDPAASVKPEVDALRAEKVELVVLLGHAPEAKLRALAAEVPGIDVALGAHPEVESQSRDEIAGATLVARTIAGGGAPLGVRVKLTPGGRGVTLGGNADRARGWVAQLEGQIARQTEERAAATDANVQKYLDEQLAFAKGQLEEARRALPPPGLHEVEARVTALEAARFREGWDPRIVAAIDRFKDDVEKIGLDARTLAELEAPGESPTGGVVAFRTATECAQCHAKQTEVWKRHQHSNAWASLEKAGNHKDPSCVRCHSIGFREPGGFAEPRRAVRDVNGVAKDFRNVQCEACHGPRLEHPKKPGVGFPLPTLSRCQKCHDAEHDPGFDEARFKAALTDPAKRVCVRNTE